MDESKPITPTYVIFIADYFENPTYHLIHLTKITCFSQINIRRYTSISIFLLDAFKRNIFNKNDVKDHDTEMETYDRKKPVITFLVDGVNRLNRGRAKNSVVFVAEDKDVDTKADAPSACVYSPFTLRLRGERLS